MKKVLIALDYSATAAHIAQTGYNLARHMEADAVLMHVTEDAAYYATYEYSPVLGFNNFITPDILSAETMNDLSSGAQKFLNDAKQHLGDDNIETLVMEGEIAASIIKASVDVHADVIVLGSHSRHGLEKILMGSVAEKVLYHSAIPLFIIPTHLQSGHKKQH